MAVTPLDHHRRSVGTIRLWRVVAMLTPLTVLVVGLLIAVGSLG